MRRNRQPGAAILPRVLSVGCRAESSRLTLRPRDSILASVTEALAERGCDSAVIELRGGTLGKLAYLGPGLSTDGLHAAWYSGPHAPDGPVEIEDLVMIVGRRDGQPFLHGHGVWRDADGARGAGHILPDETRLAAPVEANVFLVSGAVMDQSDEEETRFRLFTPRTQTGTQAGTPGRRAVLCRLKPNEPLHHAIEATAREHGIGRASLHGIGSLIGCSFASGSIMAAEASELLIRRGTLGPDPSGHPRARIDLAIVDPDRRIYEGEIVHGADPVCITFELLIVDDDHPV